MLAAVLFTGSLAGKFQLWELNEPLTIKLDDAPVLRRAGTTKQLITQGAAHTAMVKTNCSRFVSDNAPSLKSNETCWSYDYSDVPHGCPTTGWVKYGKFEFSEAKVGKAGISVDEHNNVGLVVTNVTFKLKPTAYTAQNHGLFTLPCSGVIDGIISGATNAVEAFINLTAEGVPIVGEGAAAPVDGLVVNLKHTLEGICGFLEVVVGDLLKLLGDMLHGLIQNDLPPIIQKLLDTILKAALYGPNGLTTATPAIDGWSKVL